MSRNLEIYDGAFIVSDAHYSHKRPEFLNFLQKILFEELNPAQLILTGDIFDALFGEIPYTHINNKQAIDTLNRISLKIEVIYLEGNHDFNLKDIFPNVKVFPINAQPVTCTIKDKTLLLSHGDIAGSFTYGAYTSIIRNRAVLSVLKSIDNLSNHFIFKKLDNYLCKKDDCKEFRGFEEFIANRIDAKYTCDYFIEGHFHQNKKIEFKNFIYINLGAFACNQRYFIVKSSDDIEFLEKTFS